MMWESITLRHRIVQCEFAMTEYASAVAWLETIGDIIDRCVIPREICVIPADCTQTSCKHRRTA